MPQLNPSSNATLHRTPSPSRVRVPSLTNESVSNRSEATPPVDSFASESPSRIHVTSGFPSTLVSPSESSANLAEARPGLFIGSLAQALGIQRLKGLGITHIVNVTRERNDTHAEQFKYLHIEARDTTQERLTPHFAEVVKFVEQASQQGGKVLIHCREGISRSATLVLAVRIITDKITLAQAFSELRRVRPVEPNPQFLAELRALEVRILGRFTTERLTKIDDYPFPSSARNPEEDLLVAMAVAAKNATHDLSQDSAVEKAIASIHGTYHLPLVFEHCFTAAMESYASTSAYDASARICLEYVLRKIQTALDSKSVSVRARILAWLETDSWADTLMDAPLIGKFAHDLLEGFDS